MGMKNKIEKMEQQIEFLYKEVSSQKQDIEELNKLVLFLAKLIANKESDGGVEFL